MLATTRHAAGSAGQAASPALLNRRSADPLCRTTGSAPRRGRDFAEIAGRRPQPGRRVASNSPDSRREAPSLTGATSPPRDPPGCCGTLARTRRAAGSAGGVRDPGPAEPEIGRSAVSDDGERPATRSRFRCNRRPPPPGRDEESRRTHPIRGAKPLRRPEPPVRRETHRAAAGRLRKRATPPGVRGESASPALPSRRSADPPCRTTGSAPRRGRDFAAIAGRPPPAGTRSRVEPARFAARVPFADRSRRPAERPSGLPGDARRRRRDAPRCREFGGSQPARSCRSGGLPAPSFPDPPPAAWTLARRLGRPRHLVDGKHAPIAGLPAGGTTRRAMSNGPRSPKPPVGGGETIAG